jgi:hypothetical protein
LIYPIILWWCLRNRPSYKPLLKTIAAGFVFLLFLLLSRISTGHLFGLFPGQMDGLVTAATVLWPALLIPIVACVRVHKSGIINAIFVLSVLSAASLAGFLYLYPRHQSSAYFLMAPRFWELGAGSLLLLTSTTKFLWPNRLNKIISISAFIGLCLALFLPIELGSIATITVILLTCILIYSLESGGPIHSLLTHKYVVAIGLISYSLYLWHWGVLAISRWTIGIHAWSIPLQTGAMLLAAAVSYRYVETPLRRADWAPSRSQTIGIGLGLCGALGLLSSRLLGSSLLRGSLLCGGALGGGLLLSSLVGSGLIGSGLLSSGTISGSLSLCRIAGSKYCAYCRGATHRALLHGSHCLLDRVGIAGDCLKLLGKCFKYSQPASLQCFERDICGDGCATDLGDCGSYSVSASRSTTEQLDGVACIG